MKLKVDDSGNAILSEGKPVYIHEDGRELPFDAPAAMKKISELNGEAKGHREKADKFENMLKTFDGIDPDKAKKALELASTLDAKKLIEAGEVERVKEEAKKAYQDQLNSVKAQFDPIIAERDALKNKLISESIGNAFSRSKFISDKLIIPAQMAQATFGSAFRVENDTIVAYGPDGNKIYSSERPGELAGFDEALNILIERYPYKDQIIKSSGRRGSGANGSGSGGTDKVVSRDVFAKFNPREKIDFFKHGGTLTE
jgi:hypothetical protein